MATSLLSLRGFAAFVILAASAPAPASQAAPFWKRSAPAAPAAAAALDDRLEPIERAIEEGRLVDAGQLIDQQALAGGATPRLKLLTGELGLARGQYEAALDEFRAAARSPDLVNRARQGEALALAHLGHADEALPLLKQVVAVDPNAWRAWNALGAMYDRTSAWSQAEAAYQHAMDAAPSAAAPLNNRGYSYLLQGRLDQAAADFVTALQKKPDLAEARANLRLALALRGDYDRATDGVGNADRAALLNNAGLAAGARGDFGQAESLLQRAITTKGEFYPRASENLTLIRELQSRVKGSSHGAP